MGIWRPAHLGRFIGDYPDLLLDSAPFAHRLLQIGERLDVKEWTNIRNEEVVKPHCFIKRERLEERFVKQRYRPHDECSLKDVAFVDAVRPRSPGSPRRNCS